MPIAEGLRSTRHILMLFLGTAFVLLAALGWFGARTFERDRAVAVQRTRERLESAADLIAGEIRQNLIETEEKLTALSFLPETDVQQAAGEYSKSLGEDALIVVFASESVQAYPGRRLLYYPALPPVSELEPAPYAAGEGLEFRADFTGAARYFRDVAWAYKDSNATVRAGALLRLARNQRKAGQQDAALGTYSELAAMGAVPVGEWPAELAARIARCDLLERMGRETELRGEARKLSQDLQASRWRLTRSAYLHFTGEVERWMAGKESGVAGPSPAALSLANGVDALWTQWQEDRRSPTLLAGRRSAELNGRSVFLLWRGTQNQLVGLVAGPGFLSHGIVAPLRGLLERQGAGVALADGEGKALASESVPTADGTYRVLRTMADTRLPWMLRVATADAESDLTYVASRGRLLFSGFAFLALLVVGGTYFSVRVISREVEIARLQSEFVAAVSHEFRTPLTTLRQFTDLLVAGRVATDDDRERYYAALRRGTRRLNHLVENLLDFGRIEAGFHRFTHKPVRAMDWAEGVIADFQQDVEQNGYRVEFRWGAPADTIIQADEATLGRAFWNLLDNAVKYSPEHKAILVAAAVKEKKLILSVQDRGIGVPEGEQREIFRKFVRGSSSTAGLVTGTGVGLALVDQILRSHGGKVTLESEVGQGSTFSLILPVG